MLLEFSSAHAAMDYTSQDFQDAVSTIVETKTYNWISDINTSFVLTSGYLVFMMQLGFALVGVLVISMCGTLQRPATRTCRLDHHTALRSLPLEPFLPKASRAYV